MRLGKNSTFAIAPGSRHRIVCWNATGPVDVVSTTRDALLDAGNRPLSVQLTKPDLTARSRGPHRSRLRRRRSGSSSRPQPGQRREHPQRHPRGAARLAGRRELAEQQGLDRAPEQLGLRDPPAQPAASGRARASASTRPGATGRAQRRPQRRRGRATPNGRRAGRRSQLAASAADTKHSYIPSPDTGSIRPAASPTSSARSRRDRGSRRPQRQPVAAQLLERLEAQTVGRHRFGRDGRGAAALPPARRRRRR